MHLFNLQAYPIRCVVSTVFSFHCKFRYICTCSVSYSVWNISTYSYKRNGEDKVNQEVGDILLLDEVNIKTDNWRRTALSLIIQNTYLQLRNIPFRAAFRNLSAKSDYRLQSCTPWTGTYSYRFSTPKYYILFNIIIVWSTVKMFAVIIYLFILCYLILLIEYDEKTFSLQCEDHLSFGAVY